MTCLHRWWWIFWNAWNRPNINTHEIGFKGRLHSLYFSITLPLDIFLKETIIFSSGDKFAPSNNGGIERDDDGVSWSDCAVVRWWWYSEKFRQASFLSSIDGLTIRCYKWYDSSSHMMDYVPCCWQKISLSFFRKTFKMFLFVQACTSPLLRGNHREIVCMFVFCLRG